jgi:hypothetical protein
VIHNALRTAAIHLDERALRSVLRHYAPRREFGAAYARLVHSDASQRRRELAASARYSTDWFLQQFGIDAFRA